MNLQALSQHLHSSPLGQRWQGLPPRDRLALLRMLKEQRVDAVALQRLRADFVLQSHPALALDIERAELPLEEKAYYLMLSNAFCQAEPEKAQRLWAEIERQRESSAYQARITAFLARP